MSTYNMYTLCNKYQTNNHSCQLCSIEVGRNVCHGSDAVDSAEKEIALWFPEGVCAWDSCEEKWIYE